MCLDYYLWLVKFTFKFPRCILNIIPRYYLKRYSAVSVSDFESLALLNCSSHSCHWKGSPLYCEDLHSGSESFLLLVTASANSFFKPSEPNEWAKGVTCDEPTQHNGFGTVKPYVSVVQVAKLWAFGRMKSDLTRGCHLSVFCTRVEER